MMCIRHPQIAKRVSPYRLGVATVSEGERHMRKTFTHFEQVPVEVVEKIIEQQAAVTECDGHHEVAVRKSKRAASGPRALPKKIEGITP
jgi:hypothetical protein